MVSPLSQRVIEYPRFKIDSMTIAAVMLAIAVFRISSDFAEFGEPFAFAWHKLGNMCVVCCFIVLVLEYISCCSRKTRFAMLVVVLLTGYAVIGNALNNGNTDFWVKMHLLCLSFGLFAAVNSERNDWRSFSVFVTTCNFFIIPVFFEAAINTTVLFSIEQDHLYLLGYRNGYAPICFPLIAFNCALISKRGLTIMRLFGVLLPALSMMIIWSATAIAGLLLFAAIVILYLLSQKRIRIPLWVYLLASFLVFVLIVVLRMQNQPLIQFFVENVLHKNLTFTNRIFLWDWALQNIPHGSLKDLLLGIGWNPDANKQLFPMGVPALHNYVFDTVYITGVIGLLTYLTLNLYLAIIINQNAIRDEFLFYMASAYGVMIVIMQFESYQSYSYYAMFMALAFFSCFYALTIRAEKPDDSCALGCQHDIRTKTYTRNRIARDVRIIYG